MTQSKLPRNTGRVSVMVATSVLLTAGAVAGLLGFQRATDPVQDELTAPVNITAEMSTAPDLPGSGSDEKVDVRWRTAPGAPTPSGGWVVWVNGLGSGVLDPGDRQFTLVGLPEGDTPVEIGVSAMDSGRATGEAGTVQVLR